MPMMINVCRPKCGLLYISKSSAGLDPYTGRDRKHSTLAMSILQGHQKKAILMKGNIEAT